MSKTGERKMKQWVIDSNSIEDNFIAEHIEVLDLDTGEFIRYVAEANFETGEYRQYDKKDYSLISRKGNIVCVYKGE